MSKVMIPEELACCPPPPYEDNAECIELNNLQTLDYRLLSFCHLFAMIHF